MTLQVFAILFGDSFENRIQPLSASVHHSHRGALNYSNTFLIEGCKRAAPQSSSLCAPPDPVVCLVPARFEGLLSCLPQIDLIRWEIRNRLAGPVWPKRNETRSSVKSGTGCLSGSARKSERRLLKTRSLVAAVQGLSKVLTRNSLTGIPKTL